jgi:hypothetical protein
MICFYSLGGVTPTISCLLLERIYETSFFDPKSLSRYILVHHVTFDEVLVWCSG